MAEPKLRRRAHGEDAIYFESAKNRYVGAVSLGYAPDGKRIRRKVTGKTKAEVRDKLKAAHAELDRGLHTSATYTVQQAVDDWLEGGLQGRSERGTVYSLIATPSMRYACRHSSRALIFPEKKQSDCGETVGKRSQPTSAPIANGVLIGSNGTSVFGNGSSPTLMSSTAESVFQS